MKKKGLIISTVVMVVVLIASLTTATYAWFSSTAQVKVDNLSITTISTEGLQIALKNTDNTYASGSDLIYTEGKWTGSSDTWGSSLEFKDFVQGAADGNEGVVEFAGMKDAATRVTDANQGYAVDKSTENTMFTHAIYKDVTLYSDKSCTNAVWTAGGAVDTWNTAVAENGAIANATALYAKYPVNTFLVPTGYDAAIQPTGYRPAQANKDYAMLPIVVRATSADVMQIFYQITVTPTVDNIEADYIPGMAAASRIVVNEQETEDTYKKNINPYSDAKMTDTMIVNSATNQKYGNANAYTYTGFVYNGYNEETSAKVAAGTGEKVLYLLIWIEGTDTECTNTTAGSGMTINIAIDYTKLDTSAPVSASQMGEGKKLADLGGQYQGK